MVRRLQSKVTVQCVHPASSPVLTLTDGRLIELLEPLGVGSYGSVYRGLLESGWGLKRPVAVKVIAMTPDMDLGEAMRHLGRVARRAACVRHPSVIQLLEIDRTDVIDLMLSPFIVSELVEGESLASLMKGWERDGLRVPVDFATIVALRVAEALDAALFSDGVDGSLTHLVHGDLSPRQVLISNQGEVKLGDFGQFTLSCANSHVRARSHLAYTAPEVACGAIPTSRSDVFSLGVILHEMLIGPRFAKGTSIADAAQMVRDGQVHTKLIEPNLPRALRDILGRATDRNPMERYPHARAMAFDLRREMLHLGLCDTQTCVRHTIVGWYGGRGEAASQGAAAPARETARPPAKMQPVKSDVVPRMPPLPIPFPSHRVSAPPAPPARGRVPSGVDFVVRHEDLEPLRVHPPREPVEPEAPRPPGAIRGGR